MPLSDADIRRTYGERIATARDALGLNRRQLTVRLLAAGVHITPQAIDQWERGLTSPRPGIRRPLALVLDVAADELFALPVDANEAVA